VVGLKKNVITPQEATHIPACRKRLVTSSRSRDQELLTRGIVDFAARSLELSISEKISNKFRQSIIAWNDKAKGYTENN
jgi:very-short-patch-repair endonuclease